MKYIVKIHLQLGPYAVATRVCPLNCKCGTDLHRGPTASIWCENYFALQLRRASASFPDVAIIIFIPTTAGATCSNMAFTATRCESQPSALPKIPMATAW